MGGRGLFVPFVVLVGILGFLVERGVAQNGIKHLKIYVEDIRRRETYACFPKGFSSDLDPTIYRPRDHTNYVTGFRGEDNNRINQNEIYDCDDLFQSDIRVDVWGCDLLTIETDLAGLARMFNIRFEITACDGLTFGADSSNDVVVRYFEENAEISGNRMELSGSQSFPFGFEYLAPDDLPDTGSGYIRQRSTLIGPFGPPELQCNIAQVQIPLLDPVGGSANLTVQFHVKSYNPCVDLARCVQALTTPSFQDVTKYMCPVPLCAPGWKLYNQYGCYEELRRTPEAFSFPANEGANFETFSGVYDCTGRRVQDAYCFSLVNDLASACARASIDDYAHYTP